MKSQKIFPAGNTFELLSVNVKTVQVENARTADNSRYCASELMIRYRSNRHIGRLCPQRTAFPPSFVFLPPILQVSYQIFSSEHQNCLNVCMRRLHTFTQSLKIPLRQSHPVQSRSRHFRDTDSSSSVRSYVAGLRHGENSFSAFLAISFHCRCRQVPFRCRRELARISRARWITFERGTGSRPLPRPRVLPRRNPPGWHVTANVICQLLPRLLKLFKMRRRS